MKIVETYGFHCKVINSLQRRINVNINDEIPVRTSVHDTFSYSTKYSTSFQSKNFNFIFHQLNSNPIIKKFFCYNFSCPSHNGFVHLSGKWVFHLRQLICFLHAGSRINAQMHDSSRRLVIYQQVQRTHLYYCKDLSTRNQHWGLQLIGSCPLFSFIVDI